MIDFEVTTTWGGGTVHLRPPRWWGQDLYEWFFIHLYLAKEPPTASSPISGRGRGESMLLSTWPSLQERVSEVTSHQTLGPLKHLWVAPAVLKAIRISTERREPKQREKIGPGQGGRNLKFGYHNVFLVRRVKLGLFKKSALKQTQPNGVVILNDGLTKNSEIYIYSPREHSSSHSHSLTVTLIASITILNWSTVNPSPQIICGAGSLEPLDTLTFEALEPRLKQTIGILLSHHRSSHNCQEREAKHRAVGWRREKWKLNSGLGVGMVEHQHKSVY